MNADAILKELGNEIGLGEISFGDNNVCRIVFDEVLEVDFEKVGGEILFVHAPVAKLPAGGCEKAYAEMLAANLFGQGTGGAVLALDDALGEIVMYLKYPVETVDYHSFKTDLEKFLNALSDWREKVPSLCAQAQAVAATGGGAVPHANTNFLRV